MERSEIRGFAIRDVRTTERTPHSAPLHAGYDRNGDKAGGMVKFATLQTHADLTNQDFLVV